ncbi:hypothetical protein ACI2K4_25105 [Micromonospora sp. NPDC050397]|uniref:phosphorylase family protein n=1 Tax=Micromonospora sp. NPDC050397 TaxID=3364279 RepID=UPI00384F98B8
MTGLGERTEPAGDWVLFAPMRMEARALRRTLPAGVPLRRTGRGLSRATRAAAGYGDTSALAVAGIAGGLDPALRPGDVVVATEVRRDGRTGDERLPCPSAPMLAATLRRRGLRVHLGPVVSSDRLVDGADRERLGATGALAVDTESSALLAGPAERPTACVRVIADVSPEPLFRAATLGRVATALRALARVGPGLAEWAEATAVEQVVLAAPRSSRADLVLVLGSADSSDSIRLVEVARRAGTPAHLVDDVGAVDLRWLAGVRAVGVTAGTSAPPHLVEQTVAALVGLGARAVRERPTSTEDVHFTLPKEIRPR